MSESRRWKSLKREIQLLRAHFLPEAFHPLGTYSHSPKVQAHTRAFLVLSHAEIETYLEDWAKEIARSAEDAWTLKHRVSEPLAFLLATLSERLSIPATLLTASTKDIPARLSEALTKLFAGYYSRIKSNHGIKEANFWSLFGPLGMPMTALGPTLLLNLEALGSLRGDHAHHSARAIQNVLDPETEYKRVNDILAELLPFDTWLSNYKCRLQR
jgi:hypothetical protein